MEYVLDIEWFDEGGYCQFYPILNESKKGFKEFKNRADAKQALIIQRLLSEYGLSPIVYSDIIKLPINNTDLYSSYGFVTEIAEYLTPHPIKKWTQKHISLLSCIQDLVDNIRKHTKLNFWDCHQQNVGWIEKRLVCIDTGKESFDPSSDAWGLGKPGPQCYYCNSYICQCSEENYAIY